MADSRSIVVFATAYRPHIGGAETALENILKNLPERNIHLFTAKQSRGLSKIEIDGSITIHRLGFGLPIDRHLFAVTAPFVALRRVSRKNVAFAWSLMANQAGIAAWIYKILTKTPYLLSLQEGDDEAWFTRRERLFGPLYRGIYTHAHRIHVISEHLRKRAKKYAPRARITTIPNGYETSFAPVSSEEKKKLRKKHNIPADAYVLVTASRLVKKNNLVKVVQALKGQDALLLILGEGEERKAIEEVVRKEGLEEHVRLYGSIPTKEVPVYMQLADVAIRPSLSEGLGSMFLEAMACGLPVIASPVGGIPDIIQHEKEGLLVDPKSVKEIQTAITALKTDATLRKTLAKNAQKAADRYTWEHIVEEYKELFQEITS